jgi:hypothetical protein
VSERKIELRDGEVFRLEVRVFSFAPGRISIQHEMWGHLSSLTSIAVIGEIECVKQDLVETVRKIEPAESFDEKGNKI